MKKLLTVAIAGCLAVSGCAAFAACGSGGDANHTIVFYSSQGQELVSVTTAAIEAFEAKYPGWKVEHTQPGGYDEVLSKVRSDLTAGLQPDLAYCYADHVAQYIESGKVVDMSKYLTNAESYTYTVGEEEHKVERIGFTEEEKASFITGYFEEGFAKNFTGYEDAGLDENALLTLPFVKSTEVLYYNPDALEELGYEEPPKTWKELWEICAAAKDEWDSCTPLGYDSEANWFITMAQQKEFGYTSTDPTNHYLFNNDGAKAWLNEIKGYYTNKYFTTQQIYGSYTSSLFVKGPEDGGLIFCIGSTGGAKNQSGGELFTTEVAPIPGIDEDHMQCISQGPSLVMLTGGQGASNASEKEIMTFQFVKELLDVKFQSKFSRASGYAPMRTDVYKEENFARFREGEDEDGNRLTGTDLIVSKCIKAGTGDDFNGRLFVSPAFVGSSTARQQMTSVVQFVLLGQKDAATALADAYKNCGGK